MSVATIRYMSNCLKREVTFNAILPINQPEIPGQNQKSTNRPLKSLYLLHGYTGSCNDWLVNADIRNLAYQYNIAIFMPSGENSFYIDDEEKDEYFGEFIGKELVEVTRRMFVISHDREDTFIGGLSMGGYGAIRNGYKYYTQFGKIIALSSALITYRIANQGPGFHDGVAGYPYFNRVFGDLTAVLGSEKDPEFLVNQIVKAGEQLPELFMACGDEDFLLVENRRFHEFLSSNGIEHVYEQSPGAHTWEFWSRTIVDGLNWALKKQADA